MTTALVITININAEDDAPGGEIIALGINQLLEAARTPEGIQALLGRGNPNTRLTVLRNVPDFQSIDLLPDYRFRTLWANCEQFIHDQEISCAESISQCDNVIENAYDFIEEICDLVGYYKGADSDEE